MIKYLRLITGAAILATLSLTAAPALADERLDRLEEKLRSLEEENRGLKNRLEKLEGKTQARPAYSGSPEISLDEIDERLEIVESEIEEAGLNLLGLVNISGYADSEYIFTDKNGANSGFRIHHLSLFFSKEVTEQWQFFSEIEFEDAPYFESDHSPADDIDTAQGKLLVEQMYIQYKPTLDIGVRLGRFLTPAGIWSIYHYYPYVPTQTRPMMIRKIFPQVSDGLQLTKIFTAADNPLTAQLYIANGSGNPGKLDRNENKALGAKLNYSLDLFDRFEMGVSYFREKDNTEDKRNSFGAHLQMAYKNFKFQSEFGLRRHDLQDVTEEYNDLGLYTQLAYDLGRWTLATRLDWYDENDDSSIGDTERYTGAINYHFTHNVIGKVEYNRYEVDDPDADDYSEVIASIVIAIGDM